jgi:hypothetical protein
VSAVAGENFHMTELDNAMDSRIEYLVLKGQRNFSFVDFRRFEVDGKEYRMQPGTFRNNISERRKAGKVELDYKGDTAFYTLPGHKFGKPMTPDHMGVDSLTPVGRQTPIYRWIKNMPIEKQSLHNIRLTFEATREIWTAFSTIYPKLVGPYNKDIKLQTWVFYNYIDVTVTIHHTGTVTVTIACSNRPIAVDVDDILKLWEVLVRIKIRLTNLVDEYYKSVRGQAAVAVEFVPRFTTWIAKMWHFGFDAIDEYSGQEFKVTVEEGLGDLLRIYAKRIR